MNKTGIISVFLQLDFPAADNDDNCISVFIKVEYFMNRTGQWPHFSISAVNNKNSISVFLKVEYRLSIFQYVYKLTSDAANNIYCISVFLAFWPQSSFSGIELGIFLYCLTPTVSKHLKLFSNSTLSESQKPKKFFLEIRSEILSVYTTIT